MTIGILHTTESDPGTATAVVEYLHRISAEPNYVIDPSTGVVLHLPQADAYAKALRHLAGQPETNRRAGGVIQVEIVGRASECGGYGPEWYAVLRDQLAEISLAHGITWQYREDKTRLTNDEWVNLPLEGWLGHCHVPQNDHSDPGTLQTRRIFTTPLEPQGLSDMAALQDTTPIEYHPAGDRSQPAKADPIVNAIGYIVDSAANAEAVALRIEAKVNALSQPVQLSDIRTVPTAALLAEVARRLGA